MKKIDNTPTRRSFSQQVFLRNIDIEDILENFFVSAVVAILLLRSYLYLTGYPQIGGAGLHIAHMLWGGLLMFASIFVLLAFVTRGAQRLGSIIGGFGFGLFIDELGKFITSDNNYFFKPSVAIIYSIFVLIFVLIKVVGKRRKFTEDEYLINGIDLLKESVVNDLDLDEKDRAIHYLAKSKNHNLLSSTFLNSIKELEALPKAKPSVYSRTRRYLLDIYMDLLGSGWFIKFVQLFFVFQFAYTLYHLGVLILRITWVVYPTDFLTDMFSTGGFNFTQIVVNLIAGVFVVSGILKIRRSRLHAYMDFKKYALLNLFIVQVFSFYLNQMRAVLGVSLNIFILVTLNYLIYTEEHLRAQEYQEDND